MVNLNYRIKPFFIGFIFLNLSLKIIGQSNIHIDHYTKDYGQYYRWVYDITQDEEGFLWLANHTGLRRYDGIEFITYTHKVNEANSLTTNTIRQVTSDKNGHIWAYGEDQLINRLELASGKITHPNSFYMEDRLVDHKFRMKDFGSLANGKFILLLENMDTTLQKSINSIWQYNSEINGFEYLMEISPESKGLDYFTELKDGRIWLWGWGEGYYLVDLNKQKSKFFPVYENYINSKTKEIIPVDDQRNFWYPCGLCSESDNNDALESFKLPEEVDKSKIERIRLDNVGNIWFYYDEDELFNYDVEKKTLKKFVDPLFNQSNGTRIMEHVFVDQEGGFWNGGIWGAVRFTNQKNLFKKYLSRVQNENVLEIKPFKSREIIELSSGELLVREDRNNLFFVDPLSQNVKKLNRWFSPETKISSSTDFYSMVLDKDGFLWTNTRNRLIKTNLETGQMKSFPIPLSPIPGNPQNGLNNSNWPRIFLDKNQNLWLCDPAGLSIFDQKTEELKDITVDHSLLNNGVDFKFASYNSDQDAIYSVYNRGIYVIHCYEEEVELIEIFKENEKYDVLITAILWWNDEYWLSTNKGLIRFNPKTNQRRAYTINDGLSSSVIYCALSHENELWLATQNGLCQFNPYINTATPYFIKDGLINNAFNLVSYIKTRNGNLYFGNQDGIIGFDPEQFKSPPNKTGQLHLTEISKHNLKEELQTTQNGPSLADIKEMIVGANERNLIIKYAVTTYSNVEKNQYAHYMEGLEAGWINDGNKNEVRYSQIPPGSYTLRVKAFGPNKVSAFNELAIPVVVEQYWYLRWWALALYSLILFGIVVLIYRYQLNQKLNKQEAERIKDLDRVKTRMYTNITHEFRTPLTVMLGMNEAINEYVHDGNLSKLAQANEMIDRNGKNLLNLINQMLDLSKLESGTMNINNIQEDIIAYLKYRLEPFHTYASKKGIQLSFHTESDEIIMDFDEEKISHIIGNLVSNAIKFTPMDGEIKVFAKRIKESNGNPLLEIRIVDNGIGIEPDKVNNIFDRFFMVDDAPHETGSGIGLSLVKEMVKLLNGNIEVKSKINQGTEFSILLPITNIATRKNFGQSLNDDDMEYQQDLSVATNGYSNKNEKAPLILIVEDNADVLHYIGISIKDHYSSVVARDGKTGIEKAIELIPDIIISDVMMPVKDGFELCSAVKKDERTNHIPIILLTAKSDDESKIEGLEKGADAYLSKPFNRKELLVRLENLLTIRKELQKKYAQIDLSKPINTQLEKIDPFLYKIRQIILDNIEEEDFNVLELSKSLFMSRVQLHRKLTALTGYSTSLFIRKIKLDKAKELLLSGDLNVSEVAYRTGFKTQAHFSRVFSDAFGISPSNYPKN